MVTSGDSVRGLSGSVWAVPLFGCLVLEKFLDLLSGASVSHL